MQALASELEYKLLKSESSLYPSHILSERQICDLELILNGGFYPLNGFLNQDDYQSVLDNMRLHNGSIWPIPINLDVKEKFANSIKLGDKITLKDKEGFSLAILDVSSIWIPNKEEEAQKVFGSTDIKHPAVNYLNNEVQKFYIGGKIRGISLPKHYDYPNLRLTPLQQKKIIDKNKWNRVVAFQTRNPMHRAHVEITKLAAQTENAGLLIHPVIGMTKPGDVDHFTRVRCYQEIIKKYPNNSATLSLLPLAMRMAGPREAIWHALIRKNYGCTHFIVGRDHAGPGNDSNGNPFYGPYDAQDLMKKVEDEIGIKMVPFKMMVFGEKSQSYIPIDNVPKGEKTLNISGTELRRRLDLGLDFPQWFSYPEVVKELRKSYPKKIKRGFTVFFSGLSGSGKSTLANGLMIKLLEDGRRPVTLLDGDIVRTHLSSELGFSKEHRSVNVRRIGYVASEITKNNGIAICAPIAPYEADRQFNREIIQSFGGYIEIHVNTTLAVCEERDVKGLYALAREGKIKEFTGISDPYEEPINPEIIINSSGEEPEILVDQILSKLKYFGYIN
ncbi:MAG: adenylyltransferase [Candidatus Marinimicrobia bacterium]|nr:adenylyltransferase [Candidatus Neomarinimicrobiota bacterium]|tara:strand:- start:3554 stop:5230 length:1677 start_codon:yes stop_codon:yes gene_type:complete